MTSKIPLATRLKNHWLLFYKGMPHPEMIEAILERHPRLGTLYTIGMSYAIHGGDLYIVATCYSITRERVRQVVLKIWRDHKFTMKNGGYQKLEALVGTPPRQRCK